jgi:hypothetical protein
MALPNVDVPLRDPGSPQRGLTRLIEFQAYWFAVSSQQETQVYDFVSGR